MADYRDLYFTVEDGLTLYARDYMGPAETAPVALLLHGLTRNSRDFEHLASRLSATHRVLVPEQRGRGKSEYDKNRERYQPPVYVIDMLELLSQQDIQRCAVVGTSMGGLMSMGMSALSPDLFTHIVINDIGPVVAAAGINRIKQYVGGTYEFTSWEDAVNYNKLINGAAFPDFDDEDWLRFARKLFVERDGKLVLDYDPNISSTVKAGSGVPDEDQLWDLFDTLAGKPLLLIRGENSDILDAACATEMGRRHMDMLYLEVPGVGHAPMLDEPGVAEAIIEFVNRD